jgi:hypothetical protein
MRSFFVATALLFSVALLAQNGADRITFSRFDKPKDFALLDTVKSLVALGKYQQCISEEKEVYNKADKNNSFSAVKKLLNKLSRNGTEDISQCFYPRHSINFYNNGKLVKYVLICFECNGIRFSDERWMTNVKDEQKRIKLMDELRSQFATEGL